MDSFAPIVIPTLNRHEHLKRCVESLAKCTHAEETDLFIFLDYPLKDTHRHGYEIIKAYLPNIKGFKTVNVIEREKNYGAHENFFKSFEYVFEKFDRLIFSEDDNIFAPSFLEFVNKGLNVYKDRNDIFSVAGYNYPSPLPVWYKQEAYLRTAFTAWGVGVWRDKWRKVDWSLDSFNAMLDKKENYCILKKYYSLTLPQLIKIRDTKVITGDGLLFLYLLHNNMYSVLPINTRVRNTGHDGSGEHCGHSTLYVSQQIYKEIGEINLPHDLEPDRKLIKYILKQRQPTFIQKIKMLIPASIRVSMKKYLKKNKKI